NTRETNRENAPRAPTKGAHVDFELTKAQQDLVQRATDAGMEWLKYANEWDVTNKAALAEVTQRMVELGLVGITVPKEYGGLGLTVLDYVLIVEAVMRAGTTWVVGEPMFRTSGPGVTMCLTSKNDAVKKKYLPD